jgi:hypothetical protein
MVFLQEPMELLVVQELELVLAVFVELALFGVD